MRAQNLDGMAEPRALGALEFDQLPGERLGMTAFAVVGDGAVGLEVTPFGLANVVAERERLGAELVRFCLQRRDRVSGGALACGASMGGNGGGRGGLLSLATAILDFGSRGLLRAAMAVTARCCAAV